MKAFLRQLRHGWLRIGRFSLGVWTPSQWKPLHIREGMRGFRVGGWAFYATWDKR